MRHAAPAILVSFGLAACGSSAKAPAPHGSGRLEKPRDGGAGVTDGEDGAEQDAGGGKTSDAKPEKLPPYLLSLADAKKIGALFLPYERPVEKEAEITVSDAYGTLRAFVETFLARNLEKDDFRPGRTFGVTIAVDPSINAFSTDRQKIVINEGAAANLTAGEMLPLLCHEVAHSARNHANILSRAYQLKEVVAAWDKVYAYLAAHFDEATQTYTHDLSGYRVALKAWSEVTPKISAPSKHLESEADVVGGMICAEWGLPAKDYANGLNATLTRMEQIAAADGGIAASDLEDGDSFQMDPTMLGGYLFPVDTHPSNEERAAQFARVASAIDAHLDAASGAAADWRRDYTGGGAGLSLTEAGERSVITANGRRIGLPRPGL